MQCVNEDNNHPTLLRFRQSFLSVLDFSVNEMLKRECPQTNFNKLDGMLAQQTLNAALSTIVVFFSLLPKIYGPLKCCSHVEEA